MLEDLARFFGCGKVYVNRRHDNHRSDIHRYCVKRFADLRDVIVPFFSAHPLRTSKRENFEKFATIIELMADQKHRSVEGITEIASIVETMNHREAIRIPENPQRPYADRLAFPGEMMRWSDPCGDVGRPAETTGPPIIKPTAESRAIGFQATG